MSAMVRAQAVRGYRGLVAELGGDPVRLLRAAKIKGTAFDQRASVISPWRRARRRTTVCRWPTRERPPTVGR
jgi:hypothetical protein